MRGRSVEYLPPNLRDEAYAFEENGRWERVPYEGTERWCWRPRVVVGWSPFTVGRWTDWYGDQTWIPAEPFGYVTHHYGLNPRNYAYANRAIVVPQADFYRVSDYRDVRVTKVDRAIFYGAFSTVIIFVLWVYYSSTILMLGGEFAYFLEEDRQGSAA